jgi:hypothetical protein
MCYVGCGAKGVTSERSSNAQCPSEREFAVGATGFKRSADQKAIIIIRAGWWCR